MRGLTPASHTSFSLLFSLFSTLCPLSISLAISSLLLRSVHFGSWFFSYFLLCCVSVLPLLHLHLQAVFPGQGSDAVFMDGFQDLDLFFEQVKDTCGVKVLHCIPISSSLPSLSSLLLPPSFLLSPPSFFHLSVLLSSSPYTVPTSDSCLPWAS